MSSLVVAAQYVMLELLEQRWAYPLLFASGIVLEEATPILGGFAAHEGHIGVVRAVLACAAGTWAASTLLYFVGRARAEWVEHRWLGAGGKMSRALGAVRKRPWRAGFFVRWAFGARIVLPLVCGAVHVPLGVYLAASAISSVLWSAVFTAIGWAFGESALIVLGHVKRYENVLVGVIVAVVVAFFVVAAVRRRRRQGRPAE